MTRFRRRRDEGGAAAVEFALVMIPFFVLIAGLIQYGWYFYVASNTSGALSTTARKMEVGDCWASGVALTYAKNQSPQITGLTKSPSQDTAPVPGTTFTVTVSADAKILGFLPMPSDAVVTRTVTAQMEDDQATSC
jgi:Flp pilus assembly protein TadG